MSESEPKLCTTSGEPVDKVRAEQTETQGQHKSYIVLCPNERAKGFMRPYRDRYQHVGRSVCGKYVHMEGNKTLGGMINVCMMVPDHDGECIQWKGYSQPEAAEINRTHLVGGCGTVTTMGQALSETYARDPSFYGATFCCGCNVHLPVGPHGEFVWDGTNEKVGT